MIKIVLHFLSFFLYQRCRFFLWKYALPPSKQGIRFKCGFKRIIFALKVLKKCRLSIIGDESLMSFWRNLTTFLENILLQWGQGMLLILLCFVSPRWTCRMWELEQTTRHVCCVLILILIKFYDYNPNYISRESVNNIGKFKTLINRFWHT